VAIIYVTRIGLRNLLGGAAASGILLAGLLGIVRPASGLPVPSGPYAVGTTTVSLARPIDAVARSARPMQRRFSVQVWYPTGRPGTPTAPDQPGPNVTVASAIAFPVIVYVASWLGRRDENIALAEGLASNGFVVAGLDGTARVDPDDPERSDEMAPMDFSSASAFQATVALASRKLRKQALDARFVLDRLAALNAEPGSSFSGRLDLAHVGIAGFSFGGSVAAETCVQDSRFRAAMNMDGWLFGDAARVGVRQPYLSMTDDTPLPSASDLASPDPNVRYPSQLSQTDYESTMRSVARWGGLYLRIAGSRHANFSDKPMLLPFQRFSGGGPIDPRRASQIILTYATAFFQAHLQGRNSPPLTGDVPDFPEVSLEVRTAP
jgi:dienelactone hydrolase